MKKKKLKEADFARIHHWMKCPSIHHAKRIERDALAGKTLAKLRVALSKFLGG